MTRVHLVGSKKTTKRELQDDINWYPSRPCQNPTNQKWTRYWVGAFGCTCTCTVVSRETEAWVLRAACKFGKRLDAYCSHVASW